MVHAYIGAYYNAYFIHFPDVNLWNKKSYRTNHSYSYYTDIPIIVFGFLSLNNDTIFNINNIFNYF